MTTTETVWIAIGFLGQGLFFGRWLIQWIVSERQAESRMPIAFWYMSLVGGLITLAYAIYRRDPVFIAGQGVGAVVYIRNLMLIHRQGPPSSTPIAKHLLNLTLLAVLAGLLFFLALGSMGLTDRDEGRNAEAGREMLETGDWISPTFNYEPRFAKPALVYWLMSLSFRWF